MARMLATVSKAKSVQQVHEHLKTSALAEKLEMPWSDVYGEVGTTQDCEILSRYIGKTFVWQMDGASYHKVVDENFVVLRGSGGLYSPYLKDESYDPKRGWQQVRCIEYLDNGDAEWRKSIEKMPLMELKKRVEQSSSGIKWRVKALAEELGQRLWFAPPHIGKLLNPIELFWAFVKFHYKRTPKCERVGIRQAYESYGHALTARAT